MEGFGHVQAGSHHPPPHPGGAAVQSVFIASVPGLRGIVSPAKYRDAASSRPGGRPSGGGLEGTSRPPRLKYATDSRSGKQVGLHYTGFGKCDYAWRPRKRGSDRDSAPKIDTLPLK